MCDEKLVLVSSGDDQWLAPADQLHYDFVGLCKKLIQDTDLTINEIIDNLQTVDDVSTITFISDLPLGKLVLSQSVNPDVSLHELADDIDKCSEFDNFVDLYDDDEGYHRILRQFSLRAKLFVFKDITSVKVLDVVRPRKKRKVIVLSSDSDSD